MAATVFIPPSPHDPLIKMSASRPRAPLASIPNATNSPHRALLPSTKRSRAQANIAQQENEPAQKRQMVEKDTSNGPPATPRRKITSSTVEGRVFEKGSTNGQPTAFQRKLVAARERAITLKETKNHEGPTPQNLETIRQWQKHYRKVFPEYTFYLESIPDDLKARFSRQIANLGAVCVPLSSLDVVPPSRYARLAGFHTTRHRARPLTELC
jgi:regulatory subunit for Cdc7p protein kinase